jgi:hypothetical protein
MLYILWASYLRLVYYSTIIIFLKERFLNKSHKFSIFFKVHTCGTLFHKGNKDFSIKQLFYETFFGGVLSYSDNEL